jgi:Na+-driven multidrug efflux pump
MKRQSFKGWHKVFAFTFKNIAGQKSFIALTTVICLILFLLPALYALPLWIGDTGIWLSYPVSDVLSFILSAIMLRSLFKKFNRIKDGENPAILGSNL